MANITFKGTAWHTVGELPAVRTTAPNFTLTGQDLSAVHLRDYSGKVVVLNIFPSLDTSVCAMSVRKFNEQASKIPDAVVLCISQDLPFAAKRFCVAEGIKNVQVLSGFRHPEFGKTYGLFIVDGPLAGLLTRAVLVLDANGVVRYTELVAEITQEPNYAAAIAAAV